MGKVKVTVSMTEDLIKELKYRDIDPDDIANELFDMDESKVTIDDDIDIVKVDDVWDFAKNLEASGGNGRNIFTVVSYTCAGISLLILPIFFAPAAIIIAVIGIQKEEEAAPIALVFGLLSLILMIILWQILSQQIYSYFQLFSAN